MKKDRFSRRAFLKAISAGTASLSCAGMLSSCSDRVARRRPNILFAIADDQSWLHAGAYGDEEIKTPAFDRIAREGVLFNYAYVACPSCTPSRGAILTGQHIWRLGEGGLLFGTLPPPPPCADTEPERISGRIEISRLQITFEIKRRVQLWAGRLLVQLFYLGQKSLAQPC